MSEEDKLFNFLSGLQPWAQAELRRQGVKDIPTAMAAAEALVDFRTPHPNTSQKEKSKSGEGKQAKTRNGKKKASNYKKKEAEPTAAKERQPSQQLKPRWGCFICKGPHHARDCPKREVLSALVSQGEGGSNTEEAGPSRVNPLQLLNTISAEKLPPQYKSLMYTNAKINGRDVRAMLDTGATNNFVSRSEAERLGLQVSTCQSRIKAVNSGAMPVHGSAEAILEIGSWRGMCSLMVVQLDDFELILGMEFFTAAKVTLMPHLRGVLIGDEGSPCFIQTEQSIPSKDKGKEIVSAKQLDKGL